MIIKSFEIEKIKSIKNNFILIYGTNQGYKNQVIKELLEGEILRFDENDILNNHEEIVSNLMNKSLFDEKKLIIIFIFSIFLSMISFTNLRILSLALEIIINLSSSKRDLFIKL